MILALTMAQFADVSSPSQNRDTIEICRDRFCLCSGFAIPARNSVAGYAQFRDFHNIVIDGIGATSSVQCR